MKMSIRGSTPTDAYARAALWGALCGLRTLAGPALVSRRLARRRAETPLARALESPKVRLSLEVLAVAEVLADKTPWIPSRISSLPLLGRAVSGGLVAHVVTRPPRGRWRRWLLGRGRTSKQDAGYALAGAAAAVASAYGAYWLRQLLAERSRRASAGGGVAEDLLVLLSASRLRA